MKKNDCPQGLVIMRSPFDEEVLIIGRLYKGMQCEKVMFEEHARIFEQSVYDHWCEAGDSLVVLELKPGEFYPIDMQIKGSTGSIGNIFDFIKPKVNELLE